MKTPFNNKMLKQILVYSLVIFFSVFVFPIHADITTGLAGQWDFDNASDLLVATTGNDLALTGSHSAIAGIDTVAGDGAISIGPGSYYTATHGISPNGGGSYVNEWTYVVDFKYPTLDWICFFQTNQSNGNDGDCFVRGGGGVPGSLGVSATGYTGWATVKDTWYRMVVTVDNDNFYKIYVNGELELDGTTQGIDGRFSLDPTVLLFADNNGEDEEIHVSMVALYNRALTASDVAELKGPGGQDVVHPPATPLTEPYLQDVKQDGIIIMWEMSGPTDCSIEYGTDTNYGQTADTTSEPTPGGTDVYRAVITGLDAGTAYHYRTIIDGAPGTDQTFKTAPIGYANFSFGAWSDSQGTNHNDYPADPLEPTKSMIAHMGQNVDIAISCGDMAENGGSYSDVKQYYVGRVAENLGPASVPYYVAWGNHCNYGGGAAIKPFAGFQQTGNYSFNYAGCHFICLDDATDTDYAWVENDLQQAVANNARFIFLFVHHPPYLERWYSGETGFRTNLVPLMEQYGVDICFSGHMHGYQRGYLNGVYYCVTGGGSWLDYPEPLTTDWPHMTVGGYTNTWGAYGISGGLLHEYVRIDVDEFGFSANMIGFHPDGSVRPGVTDVFGKVEPLADIVTNGKVDLYDFTLMADRWMDNCAGGNCGGADVNGDGDVNINDLHIMALSWLWP